MIIGLPKRTLLALPRAARRRFQNEKLVTPRPRLGLFAAFATMMERQAALILRGMGE